MTATAITVADATLYYGTDAEIQALSGTKGDVGFASDTNSEYTCIADGANWLQTRGATDGAANMNIVANSVPDAQSYYYTESVTTTAAATTAILTTGDLTVLGLPFKTLIFTKTGTNAVCTVNLQASPSGVIVYISATTDTLAITATNSDGNTLGTISVDDAGTVGAATGLATGTYTVYLGG